MVKKTELWMKQSNCCITFKHYFIVNKQTSACLFLSLKLNTKYVSSKNFLCNSFQHATEKNAM
jgi:hypothetical protein